MAWCIGDQSASQVDEVKDKQRDSRRGYTEQVTSKKASKGHSIQ
jgi:hypothetical protein